MSLVSPGAMAALRSTAELGMVTPVLIYDLVTEETATGSELTYEVRSSTVNGWLYSTPSPVISLVSGAQALVNTYRLFLPVGTDIETGDRCEIGGNLFTVSDTTAESTWNPLLTVSLRRVE
jgi:hypothetical protein